jgi:hypothetical protein
MRISNAILGLCLAGSLHADDVTLAGGSARLTGTVRSINEAGVVELSSALSPEPLLLKSAAVEKVEFSSKRVTKDPPVAVIELANGDLLPADIEALDERDLTVTSPEAGRLVIPRSALRSMQLGIQRRKVVYAGPRNLEEWTAGGDVKNWVFEHNGLVANGPASASKKITLPQQFILRFTLKWEARQTPNFQIYFADPLVAKGVACDRYFLRFSGAGLDVKREASKGKRYTDILLLNRTPNQYPERQLQVEIRVDRKGSRFHIFLNGESEGVFIDPIPAPPDGSGITLTSTAPNGSSQEIRDIEILEFDDSRGRHRSEERGDPKNDSLISREDDRWGGRLMEIRRNGAETVFRFKSDFLNEPLEIPAGDVSTVFFATMAHDKAGDKAPPFVLRLRGEGSLHVATCRFTEAAVAAVHPLLGPMNFLRDGIVAMERTDSNSKTAPKP